MKAGREPSLEGDDRLLDAVLLAVRAHQGQCRKNGDVPYVTHPIRVARMIAELSIEDPEQKRQMIHAALLHDVLEDTEVPEAAIVACSGQAVLELVRELTQDGRLAKGERKRKMLDELPSHSLPARIVKLADRIDNVSELEKMPPSFIKGYLPESRKLLERLRGTHAGLEARLQTILDRFA